MWLRRLIQIIPHFNLKIKRLHKINPILVIILLVLLVLLLQIKNILLAQISQLFRLSSLSNPRLMWVWIPINSSLGHLQELKRSLLSLLIFNIQINSFKSAISRTKHNLIYCHSEIKRWCYICFCINSWNAIIFKANVYAFDCYTDVF